jgi:O-antigen/teichoic acid export membrane protein
MGCVGGLLLGVFAHPLAVNVLRVPDYLAAETVHALKMCAIAMPIIIMTPSVIGVLQAGQRFDLTVMIQTPFAIGQFALPYLCARHGMDLSGIIGVLLLSRTASFLLMCVASAAVFPGLLRRPSFSRAEFRSLLGFGSWVTIGTLIAPLVLYADRFVVSRVLSLSYLAFYSIPADALIRLMFVPASIVSVAFPAFSQLRARADGDAIRGLAYKASRSILYLMVVPLGAMILCGPQLMNVWMGTAFAQKASVVLQILALGALANAIARIPFGLLQAVGRPDLPSKLQLIELPFQVVLTYVLTVQFGLRGTAIAWTLRMTLDMLALFFLAHRAGILLLSRAGMWRAAENSAMILAPAVLMAVALPPGLDTRMRLAADAGWVLWSLTIIALRGMTAPDRTAFSRMLARA